MSSGRKLKSRKRLAVVGPQTRSSLKRLVDEGTLEKLPRPVRYRRAGSIGPLFDREV